MVVRDLGPCVVLIDAGLFVHIIGHQVDGAIAIEISIRCALGEGRFVEAPVDAAIDEFAFGAALKNIIVPGPGRKVLKDLFIMGPFTGV